jgi:hypothetical protein
MMEAKLVISMVLKAFIVSVVPEQQGETEITITLRPKQAMCAHLKQRA